eukprot:m.7904 g.7904  ORF g.7904 m.7904 type:complete len:181 (-) comp3798_c0_seq1:53-595(-)
MASHSYYRGIPFHELSVPSTVYHTKQGRALKLNAASHYRTEQYKPKATNNEENTKQNNKENENESQQEQNKQSDKWKIGKHTKLENMKPKPLPAVKKGKKVANVKSKYGKEYDPFQSAKAIREEENDSFEFGLTPQQWFIPVQARHVKTANAIGDPIDQISPPSPTYRYKYNVQSSGYGR